jgi:fatty acid desaturase
VEWPTVFVAVAIGGGFAGVLAWHETLPVGVVLAVLAVLGAWYNSLQHEVIHGHPTPWPFVNTTLAVLPLGLVVPFSAYRESHLAHHRSDPLTDPDVDPESFYVSAAAWRRCGPVRRALLLAMTTLAGRMVLGPPAVAIRWCRRGVAAMVTPAGVIRGVTHASAVTVILLAVRAAGVAPWVYVAGVVWGGGALTLLRSFAEHRATDGTRSAVVRTGPLLSLLFLNNNLHHTHHARPGVAWYALPAVHDQLDVEGVAAAGAGLYRGYRDVARRYLFRPFDQPVAAGATVTPLARRAV